MLIQWQPCACCCVWPVVTQAAHSVSRTECPGFLTIQISYLYHCQGALEYIDFNSAIPLSNVINFLSIVVDEGNLAETSPKEDYVNA